MDCSQRPGTQQVLAIPKAHEDPEMSQIRFQSGVRYPKRGWQKVLCRNPYGTSRGKPIEGPNPVTTMGREPNWGPQSGTIIRDPNQRPQKILVTPKGPQLIGWHQLGTLSGTPSMDHKNWLQKVPILETPIGDLRPQKVHQGKPQKGWMDVYIDGWILTKHMVDHDLSELTCIEWHQRRL